MRALLFLLIAATASLALPVQAADHVKVGFLSTMSGPSGYFGAEALDGFNLLIRMKNGTLGGLPAEVSVADDQVNPELAKQLAERLVKLERVDFIAGTVYGNVIMATLPVAVEAHRFFISTIAGPSELAGAQCSPWFYASGYQNDTPHEAIGKYVQDKGLKSVVTIVPNFVSGRDAVAGFKRHYKGAIAAEIYIKINQLDFGSELAQVRAANPEGIFIFLPGAMGVNFIKQYQQTGLLGKVPLYGFGFNFEDDVINAVGDAVVGSFNALQWARGLDNPANRAFIRAFELQYKRLPSAYAAMGYETAQLIDGAVHDAGGKLEDSAAIQQALSAAQFPSIRGDFKFNTNHMPIQSFYLREVVRDGSRIENKIRGTIFSNYQDGFVKDCRMR
jgi:branched-chain amino acid transport system substrate-binding protein